MFWEDQHQHITHSRSPWSDKSIVLGSYLELNKRFNTDLNPQKWWTSVKPWDVYVLRDTPLTFWGQPAKGTPLAWEQNGERQYLKHWRQILEDYLLRREHQTLQGQLFSMESSVQAQLFQFLYAQTFPSMKSDSKQKNPFNIQNLFRPESRYRKLITSWSECYN